jgi:hypothetical protein
MILRPRAGKTRHNALVNPGGKYWEKYLPPRSGKKTGGTRRPFRFACKII